MASSSQLEVTEGSDNIFVLTLKDGSGNDIPVNLLHAEADGGGATGAIERVAQAIKVYLDDQNGDIDVNLNADSLVSAIDVAIQNTPLDVSAAEVDVDLASHSGPDISVDLASDSLAGSLDVAVSSGTVSISSLPNITIGQDNVGLAQDTTVSSVVSELQGQLSMSLDGDNLSSPLDIALSADNLTNPVDVQVQGSLGTVEGTDAHDAAATANPLMNGGIYDASPTPVQDGDALRQRLNEVGDVPIVPLGAVEDSVESVSGDRVVYNGSVYQLSRTNNDIATTPSTLIAAPSAGTNIVIWSLDLTTDTQQKITLNDGVGGSAIYTTFAGAYSSIVANPDGPIAELSDANALEAVLGSGGNASINISYILV